MNYLDSILLSYGGVMMAGGLGNAVTISSNVSNADVTDLMGRIIGIVLWAVLIMGVAVLIFGVVQLAQSFQEDRPEQRTKAFGSMIAGAIMIAVKPILTAVGILG